MNTLIEWDGEVDDITISYDAGISQKNEYLIGTSAESLFPAIIYPESDNLRDVTEVIWDETINKADRIDYLLAFGCGSITGLIDVFMWVSFLWSVQTHGARKKQINLLKRLLS